MSNSIAPGSSADVNVRVTALTTNPNVPVTYKTIILKKNLVNGVNTLAQEMMSATNTKYVVKYDYILGENINVPANCILEFDGGSISSNGTNKDTVTPNNTIVNSISDKAIFNGVSFNTDATHYFTNLSLVFTNFGAVSDRNTYPTTVTLAGNTYNLNAFGGTDNTDAFYSLRDFCNYSRNIKICLDGYYYSQRGTMDINGASYMELYGGHHNMGLQLVDCHDCIIRNMNFYGYYEKHDFLYTTSDNWLNGLPVCGASAVKMYDSIGIAPTDILDTSTINTYNNVIRDCYAEMRQGGFVMGKMERVDNSRIVHYAKDCIVDNCHGSHIQYQIAGTHAVNCTIQNCSVDYVLQGYDISSGSIKCSLINCKSFRAYMGSKIANEYFTVKYNSAEAIYEEITTDIISNIERRGFHIYGQAYAASLNNYELVCNATIEDGLYIQATSGYATNIKINGNGKITNVIHCEATTSPIIIKDIDIKIDCDKITTSVVGDSGQQISNLRYNYVGDSSKNFKILGNLYNSTIITSGNIYAHEASELKQCYIQGNKVFLDKVYQCLIKITSESDYSCIVNEEASFSKFINQCGCLQAKVGSKFYGNKFIWNDSAISVYFRPDGGAIGVFVNNTVMSYGSTLKPLYGYPSPTTLGINQIDASIQYNNQDIDTSGETQYRPTGDNRNLKVGHMYFDTDLGKPIYVKAISGSTVTWVDATGTTV